MRLLITGVCGFIGSHLAERFHAQGDEVFGVDNLETGRLPNWPTACELDISQRRDLYEYANVARPDLVIHCAASYKDPAKWHRDIDTNVTGTVNAVLVAKHHGCPIVYFQTALPPVSSYAISKTAGLHYIQQSGIPHLVFRLANIYGPRNLSGPVPTFYKRLQAGDPCTVVDTTRDMLYIDDLLAVVERAIAEEAEGVFDVCSGFEYSIHDLYKEVAEAVCGPVYPRAALVNAPADDVKTELDPARRYPGTEATTSLRTGIRRACAWYEGNGVEQTFTHLSLKG